MEAESIDCWRLKGEREGSGDDERNGRWQDKYWRKNGQATHSNKAWQQREKKDFTKGIKKKGREHHASLTCFFVDVYMLQLFVLQLF